MTDPGSRRWFQFSLKGLLVMIAAAAVASVAWREYRKRTPIEGVWLGTGRHASIRIAFQRSKVAISNRVGTQYSQFTLAGDAIDIASDQGVQLGLYRRTGNRLEMQLANVGAPRPAQINAKAASDRSSTYYVFDLEP